MVLLVTDLLVNNGLDMVLDVVNVTVMLLLAGDFLSLDVSDILVGHVLKLVRVVLSRSGNMKSLDWVLVVTVTVRLSEVTSTISSYELGVLCRVVANVGLMITRGRIMDRVGSCSADSTSASDTGVRVTGAGSSARSCALRSSSSTHGADASSGGKLVVVVSAVGTHRLLAGRRVTASIGHSTVVT